jgi:O-methyltransferase domain/Dimerisation domain
VIVTFFTRELTIQTMVATLPSNPTATVPPEIALLEQITGMWLTQAIYVAARLGVADLLSEGALTVDDLAAASGAQASHLYRILRLLASRGIFTEVEPQVFALTEMAQFLREDVPGSLRSLSLTISDEWQWNCYGDLLNVVQTGQSAMQKLYGVADTFEYLQQHPIAGQTFDRAMTGWAKNIHAAVIDCYDFSSIQTLVDVAGGHGFLLSSILAANPDLQGILFDLANVVVGAPAVLASLQVRDRCQIMSGSFFEEIPSGGDAYLLSHILHDWGDADCIRILRNIRKSISPGGKLIVLEMVIPAEDTPHFGKLLDITMMAIFSGGRERTQAEYAALFEASGFQLTRIVPTSSPVSAIEAVCR